MRETHVDLQSQVLVVVSPVQLAAIVGRRGCKLLLPVLRIERKLKTRALYLGVSFSLSLWLTMDLFNVYGFVEFQFQCNGVLYFYAVPCNGYPKETNGFTISSYPPETKLLLHGMLYSLMRERLHKSEISGRGGRFLKRIQDERKLQHSRLLKSLANIPPRVGGVLNHHKRNVIRSTGFCFRFEWRRMFRFLDWKSSSKSYNLQWLGIPCTNDNLIPLNMYCANSAAVSIIYANVPGACLLSSRAFIIVNGSPTKEFSMGRGLRQGDPLSPFLFIIAKEGLHVAMEDAIAHGLFRGAQIGYNQLHVSHLFYADDALFLGEWDAENIKNLIAVLNCYFLVSWLRINLANPIYTTNLSMAFGLGIGIGLCGTVVELLTMCTSYWKCHHISRWCSVVPAKRLKYGKSELIGLDLQSYGYSDDIPVLLDWVEAFILDSKKRKVVIVIIYTTIWMIWRFRNSIVFQNPKMKKSSIYENIVIHSFDCHAGISAKKKAPVNFLTDSSDGRSTLRSADVLVVGWVGGKHVCMDLTGVSSLVGLSGRGLKVGQTALKAASCKVTKHERACIENQHVFIPFAFDTFSFLAPEAVELLNRVQRVMNSNVMTPRSTNVVFHRINFAIQKGLAAQLVTRLSSTTM
ncbi:hypothetical protein Tco_0304854 [Tanacetum coccineum]